MTAKPSSLSRYLPNSPLERASLLTRAAHEDEVRGLWQSAETNLRLALCYLPGDLSVTALLDRVLANREQQRLAAVR